MNDSPTPAIPLAATGHSEVDRDNPWPGLRTYDEAMHAFFFGRSAEVEELLRLVRRDPVALFYGQSGLGKSSVLQAGLFPKLRAADLLPVHIRLRYTPEFPHPVEQVLREVAAAAHAAGGEAPAPTAGTSLFEYFYDEEQDFWSARNRVITPVLVFDQFEEIFTLGGRDAASQQRREELLHQLADLAAHRPPPDLVRRFEDAPELAARFSTDRTRCRMLFSMREDFLPDLGSLRAHLPTLPAGGLRLQRLSGAQAQEVLERAGPHLLGEGVTERIIRFVAAEKSGGATELTKLDVEPALLSVVASELNHRRRQRGLERISTDLVQGAREEILNDFYERALGGLDVRVREFIEEQLLTTTGFRDSIAVEDAEASFGVSREVLAQLVDRRLLRIDERFQLQRVELTHDLLTAVVKSSRDHRRERQAAEAAQRRAEEDKRTAQAAAAQAQAKLKRTRIRVAIFGMMGLLVLGIVVPLYFLSQLAERQRDQAKQVTSRYLITQANEHLVRSDFNAAKLVLTLAEDPEDDLEVFSPAQLNLLRAALDEPPVLHLEAVLTSRAGVRHVRFAPGGRLVIVDGEGNLIIAAVAESSSGTGLTTAPPTGALAAMTDISALDLDWTGDRLAVASGSGAVAIFDLATDTLVANVTMPANSVPPDAAMGSIAGGASDGPFRAGSSLQKSDEVGRPDVESHSAVGSRDQGTAGSRLPDQRETRIASLRFSPDGEDLAAIASDGRVMVWERDRGTPMAETWWTTPSGHTGNGITFSNTRIEWLADDSLLVTYPAGGVWLTAPPRSGMAAALTGGGKTIGQEPTDTAESSLARSIHLFTVSGPNQSVTFSENLIDDELFLSGRNDASVSWYRLMVSAGRGARAAQLRSVTAMPGRVLAHATVDGRLLLTAMRDGAISVHRLQPANQEQKADALHLLQTVAGPKSAQVELIVRPDGRVVAAVADDGRIFLYRVEVHASDPISPDATVHRIAQSDVGRWQITAPGEVVAAGGADVHRPLEVTETGVTYHALHRSTSTPPAELAFASSAQPDAEVDGIPVGVWSLSEQRWLWKKPERAFGLERIGDIASFEDAIQFSPDGQAVLVACRASLKVHVVATSDGREIIPPLTLSGDQKIRQIAWSGNGRHLAIATDNLEILLFELDPEAGRALPHPPVPVRGYEVAALALAYAGDALGYVTSDQRLVIELLDKNQSLVSLTAPLSGSPPRAMAFAPDASSILLLTDAGPTVRQARPSVRATIEWLNQRQRTTNGFGFEPFRADGPAGVRDLNIALWHDDAGSRSAMEFRRAWAPLVGQWIDWVESARVVVTRKPTPALESARVTAILEQGRELAEQIESHGEDRPAVQAFSARAAAAMAEPLALYDYFGVTPLWSQVASYLFDYDLTHVSVVQATGLFPTMIERLKSQDEIGDSEIAFMKRVVRVLAGVPGHASLVHDQRAALRSASLFTPDEWDQMVLASPDSRLLDLEAASLFDAGEHTRAAAYYTALVQSDPANLRYATLEAQNFRFQNKWAEALVRYQKVLERAQTAGQLDFAGEAAVCMGWCLQGLGRLDEADAAMLQGPMLAPANGWVLRYAATYFLDRQQPDRTAEWTSRLMELTADPAAPQEYRWVRARYHATQGQHDEVRTLLRAVADSGKASPQLYYDAGEMMARLPSKDDKETGATWLLEAYNKTTDRNLEFRALGALGPIWTKINNYTGAQSAYRLRLENYAPSELERLDANTYLAWLRILMRDSARARDAIAEAIALDEKLAGQPGHDRFFIGWVTGLYHEWTGNANAALAAYAKADELEPGAAWTRITALRRMGRNEEAGREIERALATGPENKHLRLLRAELQLAVDPDQARAELLALDDGSLDSVALRAAALRGEAAAAAARYAGSLEGNDPYAEESIELAGLHALAWRQTSDDTHRQQALVAVADALWKRHRGNFPMHHEFGLDVLRDDAVFQVGARAIAAPFESRESMLDLARIEAQVATILPAGADRTRCEQRARGWLKYAVGKEILTTAEIRADPELAAYVPDEPQPAEAAETTAGSSE